MRASATLSLVLLACAIGCGPGPSQPPPSTAPPAVAAIAVVDGGAPAAAPEPAAETHAAGGSDCVVRQAMRVTLGDDRAASVATWKRCGPREATATTAGTVRYPRDVVTLTTPSGEETLYDNDDERTLGEFHSMRAISIGPAAQNQLFIVIHVYGTGNVHEWRVLDRKAGKLRQWHIADRTRHWSPQLKPDEYVGKQISPGPAVVGSGLVETHAIYASGDPNCCPTGGVLHTELDGADGKIDVVKVWRGPGP